MGACILTCKKALAAHHTYPPQNQTLAFFNMKKQSSIQFYRITFLLSDFERITFPSPPTSDRHCMYTMHILSMYIFDCIYTMHILSMHILTMHILCMYAMPVRSGGLGLLETDIAYTLVTGNAYIHNICIASNGVPVNFYPTEFTLIC